MNDGPILDRLAAMWQERDPVPPGLVQRMQRAARAEDELIATDWDHELMLLVERSEELAGARGSSASVYTLRFNHGDTDLLLRVAPLDTTARIDGWLVPALPATVQALTPDGGPVGEPVTVGDLGRFELTDVPRGLTRLRLEPHDGSTPIVTPTFEI